MFRRMNGARSTAIIPRVISFGLLVSCGCGKNSDAVKNHDGKKATSRQGGTSQSQDAKVDANATTAMTEPEFVVPDGTSTEILAFVRGLGKRRSQFKNQKDALDYSLKTQNAIIRAGDKILALKDSDEETLKEALTRKLVSTIGLVASGGGGSPEKTLAEVERLRADSRPVVAEVASQFLVPARTLNLKSMSVTQQQQLSDDAVERVVKLKASQNSIGDVAFIADQLLKANQNDAAASLFERLADAVENSTEDEKTLAFVPQLRGRSNRLRLPGSELKLEGSLLGGGDLDWDSYRGKVVLVDFWATWCGPCVAELPNIQANYAKYNERGFDVLGISLDNNLQALEKFLQREALPWKQLFDVSAVKENGWQHPMAVRYGVTSIPSAFLVDREGKVVSTNARGAELERQLKHLLGTEK